MKMYIILLITVSAAVVNQYKSNEMKVDLKQTTFINSSNEIREKYEGEQ